MKMKREDEEGEAGGEARGRGGSVSQLSLLLLLSRLGAAESPRPAVVPDPLGRLGEDDLYLRRRAGHFCSRNSTAAFGGSGRLRLRRVASSDELEDSDDDEEEEVIARIRSH